MQGRDTLGKKISSTVLAFIMPPAAVAMETGEACETWVNFGLMLLGWIPGTIHALMVTYSPVRCGCVQMGNVPASGMPISSSGAGAYGGTGTGAYTSTGMGAGYSAVPQRAAPATYGGTYGGEKVA